MARKKINLIMESPYIFDVFKTVFQSPNGIILADLSTKLKRKKSTITTQIAVLDREHLITKTNVSKEKKYDVNITELKRFLEIDDNKLQKIQNVIVQSSTFYDLKSNLRFTEVASGSVLTTNPFHTLQDAIKINDLKKENERLKREIEKLKKNN